MSDDRIQRILARAGVVSRRKAKELLREGRVTVNGKVAEVGDRADPESDSLKVDGKRIQPHSGPRRYLLLNKPRGVLSTVSDPGGRPTVLDLVPPALRRALVPVGRLDFNTEGLILLTDDGELAQHVAHPRYGGIKTYEVKVKGRPQPAQLDRLRAGVPVAGRRTAPARITERATAGARGRARRSGLRSARSARSPRSTEEADGENTWYIVELGEGRSRQIREMFFQIGHPVQKLRRVAIGPLRDPHLPVGAVRELSEREVEMLRRTTARSAAPRPKTPRPAAERAGLSRSKAAEPPARRATKAKPAVAGRNGAGTEGGEPGPARRRAASRSSRAGRATMRPEQAARPGKRPPPNRSSRAARAAQSPPSPLSPNTEGARPSSRARSPRGRPASRSQEPPPRERPERPATRRQARQEPRAARQGRAQPGGPRGRAGGPSGRSGPRPPRTRRPGPTRRHE